MSTAYISSAGTPPTTEMETAYAASPRVGSRPDFEYPEQVAIMRRLGLEWMPHLSDSEFRIVAWVLSNTVLRGKRSGVYSIPQICEGIPNHRDGGMWAAGTGLSRRSVIAASASLRAKGLIHTEITPRGTRFTVVVSWSPATGEATETNVVALNLPRAARRAAAPAQTADVGPADDGDWADAGAEFAPPPVQNLHLGGRRICTPSNTSPTNTLPTNEGFEDAAPRRLALPAVRKRVRPASPVQSQTPQPISTGEEEPTPHCAAPPPEAPRFDPRSNVADAIVAAGQLRAKRLAEARKKVDTHSFETTWGGAWAETFPGVPCPAWSQKQAGMLKRMLKASWPKRHEGRVHEFLHWAVVNWDVILGAKLGWMQKSAPPSKPCIEFVARFIRNFQEAWADKEELIWRGTQPEVRQEALALAKRERITIEVAMARVVALHASIRDRKAIGEAELRIARQTRMAERDAAAARATRFTKENPHPRAHEMAPVELPQGTSREPDWANAIKPLVFVPFEC